MIRKIVKIDAKKCDGCGLCVQACHEGAIGMKGGKAHLLRDDYCDGLGDCLPACPAGAITFEEREASPYDEAAVQANMAAKQRSTEASAGPGKPPRGCPGSQARGLGPEGGVSGAAQAGRVTGPESARPDGSRREFPGLSELPPYGTRGAGPSLADLPDWSGSRKYGPGKPLGPVGMVNASGGESRLRQWPVQIKLVPAKAAYLDNAHLLIAADCAAYAYGNFHRDFIQGRVTLIGCPKLDQPSYYEKLLEIFRNNNIKSVTVARMSVPCCGGLEQAAKQALRDCGKMIPWNVVTITPEGKVEEG